MESHQSTTPFGRRSLTLAHVAAQATAKARPPDKAVHKWQVFRAICTAKARVGVSERALAVLDALLSFHPETTLSGEGLIVFAQNHDQVGNRLLGDRLAQTASFEQLKLAAGAVLLAPYIPLLFMGEEYGEIAPFQYFVNHGDPELVEAVRKGRAKEFARFRWGGEIPDPQSEETFRRAKLNWELRNEGRHRVLLDFYRELLRMRLEIPALAQLDKNSAEVTACPGENALLVRRWSATSQIFAVFNFNLRPVQLSLPVPAGNWQKQLDSAESRWQGEGSKVADSIDSSGRVQFSVAASALCLFTESREKQR